MNDENKSDLLDTTDAKPLTETDKEVLRSAPHSGGNASTTGIAGAVMSDSAYIERDENSEFNSDLPIDSGVINQTVKPDSIKASLADD